MNGITFLFRPVRTRWSKRCLPKYSTGTLCLASKAHGTAALCCMITHETRKYVVLILRAVQWERGTPSGGKADRLAGDVVNARDIFSFRRRLHFGVRSLLEASANSRLKVSPQSARLQSRPATSGSARISRPPSLSRKIVFKSVGDRLYVGVGADLGCPLLIVITWTRGPAVDRSAEAHLRNLGLSRTREAQPTR